MQFPRQRPQFFPGRLGSETRLYAAPHLHAWALHGIVRQQMAACDEVRLLRDRGPQRRLFQAQSAEISGGDADHGCRFAVQPDGSANNQRIGAEMPLPKPVVEDHHRVRVPTFVAAGVEYSSQPRPSAEIGEVIRRDELRFHLLLFALDGDPGGIHSQYGRKSSGILAEERHLRIRQGERITHGAAAMESQQRAGVAYMQRP